MKKFLVYIVLPAIVLGVVYQMGRSAGRLSVPSQPESRPGQKASPINSVNRNKTQPAAVSATSRPRSQVTSTTKPRRIPSESVVMAPVLPQELDLQPADWPEDSVDRFVQITPEEFAARQAAKSPKAVPVIGVPKTVPVIGVSRMIETQNSLGQTVYEYDAPPATNVPTPAPTISVYDGRSKGGTTKASELGVVPLAPLLPVEEAKVYPGPSSSARTTFKALAPSAASPAPAVESRTRVVSPVRITSSSQCDCGKEH